ncbi:MAG: DUF1146 family protein [Bavariicoccus seileri]|uniref:DUF1146 family protein n=1 Tax=Bavariicoccus seileri TaxID=549685 RepID=UPI003F8F31BC
MVSIGVSAVIKTIVYLVMMYISFWALQSIRLDRLLKPNFERQARMLYILMSFALGYLSAEFVLTIFDLSQLYSLLF